MFLLYEDKDPIFSTTLRPYKYYKYFFHRDICPNSPKPSSHKRKGYPI